MPNTISILDLFIYPVKSASGLSVNESVIEHTGLVNDRSFAVIDDKGQVITARENSKLLKITPSFKDSVITLKSLKGASVDFDLKALKKQSIQAQIFDVPITCLTIDTKIDQWLSNILDQACQLVILDAQYPRYIKAKYCGEEKHNILFTDVSPIHLVSKASLDDLNSRLEHHVGITNFRPNIFVSGREPYEEDSWELIKIGECEFKVLTKTKRCIFSTINPETGEKSPDGEPLKTLAQYRKVGHGIHFGVYLIPTKIGVIKTSDIIEILKTN